MMASAPCSRMAAHGAPRRSLIAVEHLAAYVVVADADATEHLRGRVHHGGRPRHIVNGRGEIANGSSNQPFVDPAAVSVPRSFGAVHPRHRRAATRSCAF